MTTPPPEIVTATIRTSTFAAVTLNGGVPNGSIVATSKVPGAFGNRVSVQLLIDTNSGVPEFTISGYEVTIRISETPTFEASGAFFISGAPTLVFDLLWFAGELNGRRSWSMDGLAVTWPLDRNGEFVLYADGSWHVIQRSAGLITMHWISDSDETDIQLIPRAVQSAEQPNGWYGGIPACTGYVDTHYGIDLTETQYLTALLDGLPDNYLPASTEVNNRLTFALAAGQSGTGRLTSSSQTRLAGGR